MKYDEVSYVELKQEVAERGIDVPGDSRTKKNLIAALELDDARRAASEQSAEEEEQPREQTALERKLASTVPTRQRLTFGRDYTRSSNLVNEAMKVRNLPADYVHGWASVGVGQGEDLGNWLALGWIRVTSDMVTSDPNVEDKIYVASYEDVDGYVRHKDCVLVVANRRLVEERKAGYAKHWNQKVEKTYGKRGELTKDRVGDPTEGSARSFKRAAQWKPEDMLEGGN